MVKRGRKRTAGMADLANQNSGRQTRSRNRQTTQTGGNNFQNTTSRRVTTQARSSATTTTSQSGVVRNHGNQRDQPSTIACTVNGNSAPMHRQSQANQPNHSPISGSNQAVPAVSNQNNGGNTGNSGDVQVNNSSQAEANGGQNGQNMVAGNRVSTQENPGELQNNVQSLLSRDNSIFPMPTGVSTIVNPT